MRGNTEKIRKGWGNILILPTRGKSQRLAMALQILSYFWHTKTKNKKQKTKKKNHSQKMESLGERLIADYKGGGGQWSKMANVRYWF